MYLEFFTKLSHENPVGTNYHAERAWYDTGRMFCSHLYEAAVAGHKWASTFAEDVTHVIDFFITVLN